MTNKGIRMCENIREILNDELTNFNDCVLVKTILSSFDNIRKDIKDTLDIDLRSCLSFKIGFYYIWEEIDEFATNKIPTITDPYFVHYSPESIEIHVNIDIIEFICNICNNSDQFMKFLSMLLSGLIVNMIKLKMLDDYLAGIESPDEKSYLEKSEEILKQQIRPSCYINSVAFKTFSFAHAFFYNEFNKEHYLPNMSNEFKDTYHKLINERLTKHGFDDVRSQMKLNQKLFKEVLSLYNKFNRISSVSDIDIIRHEIIDKQKSPYSVKISFILDELAKIYDIWEVIKKDTMKKFPMYKNILDGVQLYCMNALGMLQSSQYEYQKAGAQIPYYEYMTSDKGYEVLASMTSSYSSASGVRMDVYFNITQLLCELAWHDYDNASLEQKQYHYEFTLKHEMGHVVHYCELLSNSNEKTYYLMREALYKITDNEKKKREALPEDERIDYDYWYYTYLPMERKANELMGLTVEDIYREQFAEVPPEIKQLLKEKSKENIS